jgi:CRISPR-associated protein Cas2
MAKKFKKKKNNLSKFENMWIFAMFDLPVTSDANKREYVRFRKLLLREGFQMLQFSVYAKFCASRENAAKYCKYIEAGLPPDGQVRVIMITDKQFGEMAVFYGKTSQKPEEPPEQLLLF